MFQNQYLLIYHKLFQTRLLSLDELFFSFSAYREGALKQTSIWEAMRPLMPIFLLFLSTTFWVVYSPTNIIERDPRVFYWLVGTVFSNIAVSI